MVEALSQSADPRHRDSKFLKFLLKLNQGTYSIEDNTKLVKHADKKQEFKKYFEEHMAKYQLKREAEELDEDGEVIEEIKRDEDEQVIGGDTFKNILEQKEDLTEEKLNAMMKEWIQAGAEM